MSTTVDLIQALKNELKNARMTYADLARSLDMAESSVKRMLAKGDMPLTRVDAICRALKIDSDFHPARQELRLLEMRGQKAGLLGRLRRS